MVRAAFLPRARSVKRPRREGASSAERDGALFLRWRIPIPTHVLVSMGRMRATERRAYSARNESWHNSTGRWSCEIFARNRRRQSPAWRHHQKVSEGRVRRAIVLAVRRKPAGSALISEVVCVVYASTAARFALITAAISSVTGSASSALG